MAVNHKKILYSILKEVKDGNQPSRNDYGIELEDFGTIVEIAKSNGFIENAAVSRGGRGNKVQLVLLNNARITLNGLEYLEQNSTLTKTYKGLKELRDWIKL